MEPWQRRLQWAAAGVVVAAVMETLLGGAHSQRQSLERCFIAGGIAWLYAELVPGEQWGPRSGAAFAQQSWVASLDAGLGEERALERAGWGALTGLLLKLLR